MHSAIVQNQTTVVQTSSTLSLSIAAEMATPSPRQLAYQNNLYRDRLDRSVDSSEIVSSNSGERAVEGRRGQDVVPPLLASHTLSGAGDVSIQLLSRSEPTEPTHRAANKKHALQQCPEALPKQSSMHDMTSIEQRGVSTGQSNSHFKAGTLESPESDFVIPEITSSQNFGSNSLNAIPRKKNPTANHEGGLEDTEASIGDLCSNYPPDLPRGSCDTGPPVMTDNEPPPNYEPQEIRLSELTTNDILIAIIGPAGSGKSSFISQAAGVLAKDAEDGFREGSHTREIGITKYKIGELSNVVLVDTPGFGGMTDVQWVLTRISEWLDNTYKKEVSLSAILCFHRITDGVPWTPSKRLLPALRELCGNDNLSQIVLVTTMWDKVDDKLGHRRLAELRDNHWNAMVQQGSTHRHLNIPESAKAILQHIFEESGKRRSVTLGSMKCSHLRVKEELITNVTLIAIIGPPGSGKSSFIGQAAGITGEAVGHGLCEGSHTKTIRITKCEIGRFSDTVLVDTPGIGEMQGADLQVLFKVANWLHNTYKKKVFFSAILCFHRITDNRVPWMPTERLLPVLHELCGNETLSRIDLVTTMWDEVDEQLGCRMLAEVKDSYWSTMDKYGSTHRHSNTPKSAKAILQQILEQSATRRCGVCNSLT